MMASLEVVGRFGLDQIAAHWGSDFLHHGSEGDSPEAASSAAGIQTRSSAR